MKFWENRKLQLGIAFLGFVLSVATMIITIVHRSSISSSESDEIRIPQESSLSFETVCFDCSKLIQDPYKAHSKQHLFEFLQFEIRDGHSVCCINNTHQMELLVSTILKENPKEVNPPKAEKDDVDKHVAAHKFLYQARGNGKSRPNERPEHHIFLVFNINNSVNEHVNGVAVMEHGLVIQYTGMYYVYSSIRFKSTTDDLQLTNYTTHVQLISPFDRSTTILLKAQYSGSKVFQESTFTGGVFFLNAGDVVQVCVSEQGVIDTSESTYAGLIMLGSHSKTSDQSK